MPNKEKKAPENEDKAKETPEAETEKEGATPPDEEKPEVPTVPPLEKGADMPAPPEKETDEKQANENGEGASEPETPDAEPEESEEEKGTDKAVESPTAEEPANMELIEAKAQLAALKSGVAVNAVEDAVCLAIHDAKKSGTVDENSVAESLKSVMERHPEWKNESKDTTGFRVGADGTQETSSANDEISKIFGNK